MGKRTSLVFITVSLIILFLGGEATAGSKVQLCHLPPGQFDAWHTITVSENAVPAHLAHGDLIGACNALCAVLCDDNNACTIDDTGDCESRGCPEAPRDQVDCNDGNQCTEDTCNPDTGMCMNPITVGAQCDLCEPRPCNLLYGECDGEGECILTRYCLEDEDGVVSSAFDIDDDVTFYADNNFTILPGITVMTGPNFEGVMYGRGDIDIIAGGSFTMGTGAALDSFGRINIDAEGSATIDGSIAGADDVTLILGGDIMIAGVGIQSTSGSIVINASNNVTIDSGTAFAIGAIDFNAGGSFILEAVAQLNTAGAIGIAVGTTVEIAGDFYAERVEIRGSSLDNVFTIKPGYTTIVDVFGGGGLNDTLFYNGDGCVAFSTPTSGTIRSNVGSADINFTDIANVTGISGPCDPAP